MEKSGGKKCLFKFFYKHKILRNVPHLIIYVSLVFSDLRKVNTLSWTPCISNCNQPELDCLTDIPAGIYENAPALSVGADIKLYVLVNPGREAGDWERVYPPLVLVKLALNTLYLKSKFKLSFYRCAYKESKKESLKQLFVNICVVRALCKYK